MYLNPVSYTHLDVYKRQPIHAAAQKLKNHLCSTLLAAHALTGCDTTSSFYFIGKNKVYAALKIMSDEELNLLAEINDLSIVSAQEIISIFVSYLYDPKKKSKAIRTDINSLRYHLAIEKNVSIDKIPPSKPAMFKHILRALWQVNEWKQATHSIIISKDIQRFGWLMVNGHLTFDYYDGCTACLLYTSRCV